MKSVVAISLAVIYVALAVLHVLWALSSKSLSQAPVVPIVDGEPAIRPGPVSTLMVAVALVAAALVVLARADLILMSLAPYWSNIACTGLGLIMLVRAIGEFRLVGFFKTVRGTSFATWDSWLYSPLCLVLGLSALWLATTARDLR